MLRIAENDRLVVSVQRERKCCGYGWLRKFKMFPSFQKKNAYNI